MNKNMMAAVSYITWIGFIVAFAMSDRTDPFMSHHLNQALTLNLVGIAGGLLAVIPILGALAAGAISLAVLVLDVIGIIRACGGSDEPLPFIGGIHLIG